LAFFHNESLRFQSNLFSVTQLVSAKGLSMASQPRKSSKRPTTSTSIGRQTKMQRFTDPKEAEQEDQVVISIK
jgi:hypothetical protein